MKFTKLITFLGQLCDFFLTFFFFEHLIWEEIQKLAQKIFCEYLEILFLLQPTSSSFILFKFSFRFNTFFFLLSYFSFLLVVFIITIFRSLNYCIILRFIRPNRFWSLSCCIILRFIGPTKWFSIFSMTNFKFILLNMYMILRWNCLFQYL